MVDEVQGLVNETQEELLRAAEALEQLTHELQDRSGQIERLEDLVDGLLDVLPVAAILVDSEGRVVAMSRRAAAEAPALVDGLGKVASRLVPDAFRSDGSASITKLKDGSRLVVMGPV